jgi:IclR family transcriptional regulator, mhp operon transcriptional activator
MASSPPVEAVVRGLRVLEAMASRPVSTVGWLHGELGLPKPSIIRILQTLEACGYVRHAPQPGGYLLTSRVQMLSSGYHGEPRLVEVVAPLLDAFTSHVKWPAAIAVPQGNAVVVRYSTIPSSPLALLHSTIGMRLSLVSRALGRAYLAFCEPDEREVLIGLALASGNDEDLPAQQRPSLDATLELIRRQGYALRDKKVRPISRTLAVPVLDGKRVVAAVGMTWFASTMDDDKAVALYLGPLQDVAQQAQAALAANPGQGRLARP